MWVKAKCSLLLRHPSTSLDVGPLLGPQCRPCVKYWLTGANTKGGAGLVLI